MTKIFDSKIMLILIAIIIFIIAIAVGYTIEIFSDTESLVRYSSIDSGGPQTARRDGFYSYMNRNESFEEPLPLTVAAAINNGFFNKPEIPYLLGYDSTDELLSIYLFSKKEMPAPWSWSINNDTKLYPSIGYEHSKLIIHFKEPTNAC